MNRQCCISFDPDEAMLRTTAESPLVGADRIIWASDYPHPDAKFPGPTEELAEAPDHLGERDRALRHRMSTRPLAGKVALVSGGSRGIGRAIAVELKQLGAGVVVTARGGQRVVVTMNPGGAATESYYHNARRFGWDPSMATPVAMPAKTVGYLATCPIPGYTRLPTSTRSLSHTNTIS
jgi:hypothetical protein